MQPANHQPNKQVTFIDTGLSDYQTLIDGLPDSMEVVQVNPDQDGIQIMADWAASHTDYDAIHVLGHGSDGAQQLGSATLSSETLSEYQTQLGQIGSALTEDGDILLYGCNVAASETGMDFIGKLAQATGADLAASDDLTGAMNKGGDWSIEAQSGKVSDNIALNLKYESVLEATTLTFSSDDNGWDSDYIAEDGEGGSTDIAGITIQFQNISDTDGTNLNNLEYKNQSVHGSSGAEGAHGLTAFSGVDNGWKGILLKSSDGSEFQLDSFKYFNWGDWDELTLNVTGFRDNSQIATDSFSTGFSSSDFYTKSLNDDFSNVDEVRITFDSGLSWPTFNSFALSDAVSNSVPTATDVPSDITTLTEDTQGNIDLSAVTFADDDGDTLTVTITASTGTFANPTSSGNVTASLNNGEGSGSNIITLVGSAADINTYLDTASNIQYTGAENASGEDAATLTITADDGNGGNLASNPVVNLDITAVNDAPVLDNSGSPTLTTIDEDPTTNEGTLVSAVLGTTLTDVDASASEGIAVTAVDNTNGTWQYSTDGTNWSDVGTVADNSALLLAADDKLRFVPNADYNGSATVTYRGWDQTSGTAGDKVDTSTNGDDTAFSTATDSASITVNAANDAPTLSGGPYAFTATDEDTPSTGVLVSTLLAGVTAADVDGDTLGAAISAQTGNGTWQYSTDSSNGSDGNWTDFGTVGSANSLLLSSSTYVRYNPDGENGETASLTLYAWDGTSGSASTIGSASTASTITNGGTSAFSTGTINANLTVNPLNDAPTGTDKTLTAQKNSPLTIQIADAGFNDVDTGDALDQIIISTAPTLGTLWVDTDNDGTVNGAESALSTSDTVTATDISAGLLKYRPATDGVGSGYTTIGFTVHDGDTSAGSGNTWTLNVVSAPAIDLNGAATGSNATATYTENDSDTPVTLVDAAATITDDDANLNGMSIQISDGAQTGDVIKLGSHADNATVTGITISYTSDSEISLSGSTTKENYLALLKELTFAQTGDNVGGADRTISVTATDANNQTGLASTITVTATGVNDAPTVATNTGLTLNEAATITIANTQLNATDPDDSATGLTYTVTTATTKGTIWLDANNNSTQDDGEALALNGTFTQDDIDNSRLKYTHDGGETTSDTLGFSLADGGEDGVSAVTGQSFAITVTPQNDDPTISELSGDSLAYVMGSDALVIDQGTAVSVTDLDSTDFNTGALTVSITNNGVNGEDKLSIRNQGTETGQIGVDGFDVTYGGTLIGTLGSLNDGINGNALTIEFNSHATAAALSALLNNITYENLDSSTATENTRTVRFVLTDGDGGTSANVDTSVVVSRNAAPEITSNDGGDIATVNVAENSTAVTTVTATDADNDTLTFSISGGPDSGVFSIDANTGALSFSTAPDYETPQDLGDTANNNTYVVEVTADDNNGGTDTQMLTVTVTDDNEAPSAVTLSNTTSSLAENTETSSRIKVADIAVTDDASGTNDISLTGSDAEHFEVDGTALYLKAGTSLDYETKTSYAVTLNARDSTVTGSQAVTTDFSLNVTDTNDAPEIASNDGGNTAAINITENSTTVTTVTATDADNDSLTFSISGGADSDLFAIDTNSGALSFKNAPNFESPQDQGDTAGDNTYVVEVTADDQNGATDTQTLTVTVTDVNETPPTPEPEPEPTPEPTPEPEPEPTPEPEPEPTPPKEDEWQDLPDEDGDGIPESVEDFVPSTDGQSQGDGNGDGIADRDQSEVSSVPFRNTDKVTVDPDAPVVFVTLAATNTPAADNGDGNSDNGDNPAPAKPVAKLRDVTQLDAPEDKPDDMEMPLGLISFYADLEAPGLIQNFSLLVDASAQVNGYWKQTSSGWINLASEAYGGGIKQEGNKWQLDFVIEDGGIFDDDGEVNGVIFDPGALGYREPSATPEPLSPFEGTNAHQFFDWMLLG